MVVIFFQLAIALVLFWVLPFWLAIAAAVVITILVAAKLHDAVHHGRRIIAAGKKDKDAEYIDNYHSGTLFHAMWIGLTVSGSGSAHHHMSDTSGQHGGDFGGGFGDGGGGM